MYRLLVSSSAGAVTIYDSIPQAGSVQAQETQYFDYVIPSQVFVWELDIIVTPLAGDADLFVSLTNTHPNASDPSSYDYMSNNWGGDTVAITNGEAMGGRTVYIAVYGYTTATFTVTAALNNQITLADGVPQGGFVAGGGLRYYALETGLTTHDITITVTPRDGNVDLFILPCLGSALSCDQPSPDNYVWASTNQWFATDSVTIWCSDPAFMAEPGRYLIALQGVTNSNYTIVASSASMTSLQEGVPMMEMVGRGEYEYFQIFVPDPTQDVIIDVTPFNGDPDLFVSCTLNNTGDDYGTPSRWHNDFRSMYFGADTIVIHANDPAACSFGEGGTYYVAVYGYQNTTFSILATYSNSTRTLVDGEPQAGLVEAGTYVQYMMYIGNTEFTDVTITLTASHGDPDLYVTTDGTRPTMINWQFSSRSYYSRDQVLIPRGDGRMCHHCWLNIGVYGYSTSAFSIVASTSNAQILLQDGISVREQLGQGEYGYFKFVLGADGSNLTVTVTPLSGDPDVLVSDLFEFPSLINIGNHTWWSANMGLMSDSVVLQNTHAGMYFIAVLGWSNSTFTIQAHADLPGGGGTLQRLSDGVPQSGTVSSGAWSYYQLIVGAAATDVDIVVVPVVGSLGVFVNPCTFSRWDRCAGRDGAPDMRPNSNSVNFSAVWSSDSSLSRERVRIPASDPSSCSNGHNLLGAGCSYVIGVFGHSQASFSLTAVTSQGILELQDGVPVQSSVRQGEYVYFMMGTSNNTFDLTITITPAYGDPDIFVDNFPNTHPNRSSYTWARQAWGADTLSVEATDPRNLCGRGGGCVFFIAVFGSTNSSFTILATLNQNEPIVLVNGQAQGGSVDAGQTVQYYMQLTQPTQDIQITVSPSFGDPDLYVTLDGTKPGPNNYQFLSRAAGGDVLTLDHSSFWFQAFCGIMALNVSNFNCMIRIAVYGYGNPSQYVLTASTFNTAVTLRNEYPIRGVVPQGQWEHYRYSDYDGAGDLAFIVTSYSGDVMLFVSTSEQLLNYTLTAPTPAVPWLSDNNGTALELITIAHGDPNRCTAPCNYYVAVYGKMLSAFNIRASANYEFDVAPLVDGVPQGGTAQFHAFRYFKLTVPPSTTDVDIVLSNIRGRSYFLVNNEVINGSVALPKLGPVTFINYRWSSWSSSSGGHVTINSHDAQFAPGDYVIGVFGSSILGSGVSSFLLSATTNLAVITLLDGMAMQDNVAPQMYEYFTIAVTEPGVDLNIVLTPFVGDPDIYVSVSPNRRPSREAGQYDWFSSSASNDYITVQNAWAQCAQRNSTTNGMCYFYIAVYGFTNSSFSILAQMNRGAGHPTLLSDGVPQDGFVNRTQYNYYHLQVPAGNGNTSLTITLTPTFGDADLYILLVPPGGRADGATIPGIRTYDYRSQAWTGSDIISINPRDPAYCGNCDVVIAVYGYTASSAYTIVASSNTGPIRLRNGFAQQQSVAQGTYVYFTLGVDQPDADISLTLTALSGDPDMYVRVVTDPTQPGQLPSSQLFTWRSFQFGNDFLQIDHRDPDFCYHCTYTIGVFGYSDSQFSILATVDVSTVVSLSLGIPQNGVISQGGWKYYSAVLLNDLESLVITVTPLNGNPDLYVVPGLDTLPNMTNAVWRSNAGGAGSLDTVTIPAPAPSQFYIIGVYGVTDSEYSLTTSVTEHWILLQTGVPQRHFVEYQMMEYFIFAPRQPSCDISINVVSLNGDPDVFVSMTALPQCTPVDMYSTHCRNFTWAMTNFRSDVVNISHSSPCANADVTPFHGTPEACDPEAFQSGVFAVGVWGSMPTNFTITASLICADVPQISRLVAGIPSVALTSIHDVCDSRESDGSCAGDPSTWTQQQSAFFAMSVADMNITTATQISFTVEPSCPTTADCARLTYYVSSCLASQCSADDRYPGPFHAQVSAQAHDTPRTIFIAYDPNTPQNGFCVPVEGDTCVYYIGLYSSSGAALQFLITGNTPQGWDIIPLERAAAHQIAMRGPAVVSAESSVKFEAFATANMSLSLHLDTCRGSSSLYICDSSCSNLDVIGPSQYRWALTGGQSCARNPPDSAPVCQPANGHVVSLSSAEQDNYFMAIASDSDSAMYQLQVVSGTLGVRLHVPSPTVVVTGGGTTASTRVKFAPAVLIMSDGTNAPADKATYNVYAVKVSNQQDISATTPCGLDVYSQLTGTLPTAYSYSSVSSDGVALSHDLAEKTQYLFNVVVECDASCQGVTSASGASTQKLAYLVTSPFTTGEAATPASTSSAAILGIVIGVIVLGALATGMYMLYRRNRQLEQQLQYEVNDVRGVAPATVSKRVGKGGNKGSGYAPLLTSEDVPNVDASAGLLGEYIGDEERQSSLAERIQNRLR